MLLGEIVQEFVGGDRPTCLHVLKTLSHTFDGLLIVLTLPLEIVRQGVVERISIALSAPTGVLLKLRESFGFDR
jgi:hypothetical protein